MWPILLLLFQSVYSQLIDINNYYCGVDAISKWTSFLTTTNCDQMGINSCCFQHDQCYSSCSVPQTICDGQFCQCLSSLPADLYCRNFVIAGHCNLVQWLGHNHICSQMAQPLLG